MNAATRILLVDDHSLFRESLARLLALEPDFRVVSQCSDISGAIEVLRRDPVDVVLLDYDLGEERGTDLLEELRARKSPIKVLMVTAGMNDRTTLDVLGAGAVGVLYKHSNPNQLVDAIRKIVKGEMWLDSGVIRSLVSRGADRREEDKNRLHLSSRQREVLSGIFDGLTNKEIAWKLKVSESSVKAVIQELFHKADVRTRSQLVRIAIEKHAADWLGNEPL
jgi:two-component system nitrate/nitrite response regulator NarL